MFDWNRLFILTAEEYEEEYHNLLLRCDVLRDEEQVICDKMASLEQQKQTEHQQIENISTTQKRLQQDIKKLQKQIEDLDSHKEGYRLAAYVDIILSVWIWCVCVCLCVCLSPFIHTSFTHSSFLFFILIHPEIISVDSENNLFNNIRIM